MHNDDGAEQRSSVSEVSRLLDRLREGDSDARDQLYQLTYGALRRLAASRLRGQSPGHSLQPTDIVHETYLRLAGAQNPARNRIHFFALAATAMRQILVDHARRKLTVKRGGGIDRVTLDDAMGVVADDGVAGVDLLDLDRALDQLGQLHERQRRVVELRFFVGFTIAEAAEALGVSTDTVEDDTAVARTWLRRRLRGR